MKRNRLMRIALLALLLLALACGTATAKVVSAGKDFYYLDQANVLSEALEGEIFFSNQLLDRACGAQVVVVTVETTGSASIDDYAVELFNRWGIGDSKRDNGFLLLLAIKDEDYYAIPGAGLQGKLSAGTLKQLYEQYLEDDFAAGNYESGARRFFEAVFDRVAGAYSANVTVQQGIAAYERYIAEHSAAGGFGGAGTGHGASRGPGLLRILMILLAIYMVIRLLRRRRPQAATFAPSGYNIRPKRRGGLLKLFLLSRLFRRRPTQNTGSIWQHAHTFRPSGSSQSGGLFSGGSSHSGFGGFSRPSGGARRASGFGGAKGGGGRTKGGGAGRGRH